MADAAPDLTKPLVIDRTAFKTAKEQGDHRTDLRVKFGDGVYRFHLDDNQASQVERRYMVARPAAPSIVVGGGHMGGFARAEGPEVGLGTIYARLARGRALFATGEPLWAGIGTSDLGNAAFYRTDVELVIGRGLLGGGHGLVGKRAVIVDRDMAISLVERFVHDAPLEPLWTLAFAIVGVRLFGRQPDPETGE